MDYRAIPEAFHEFLVWFKERTEATWAEYPTATFEDYQRRGVGGRDWQRGTKWIGGYTEQEIDAIEEAWQLRFPPDYRHFLQTLGAPDRPMFAVWYRDETNMEYGERPSFYDWRKDTDAIRDALAWPLEGLLFDVEHNNLWLTSWGVRPDGLEEQQRRLAELVRQAPPLIPIIGHRYLLGRPLTSGNSVLSVYQADIISYGSDLRQFLILECAHLLGLNHFESYDEAVEGISWDDLYSVPFWGEIIEGDA